jgi:hypothetical protein
LHFYVSSNWIFPVRIGENPDIFMNTDDV